jgi:GNAT superfamily N-acetyltransferase
MDSYFLKENKDNNYIYYTLFDNNNNQIGMCKIKTNLKIVFIEFITIYKKYRGHDLSSILIKLLEDKLKICGVTKIELDIDELNEKYKKLEKLYNKNGFNVYGKERYENRGDFLVRRLLMEKILK